MPWASVVRGPRRPSACSHADRRRVVRRGVDLRVCEASMRSGHANRCRSRTRAQRTREQLLIGVGDVVRPRPDGDPAARRPGLDARPGQLQLLLGRPGEEAAGESVLAGHGTRRAGHPSGHRAPEPDRLDRGRDVQDRVRVGGRVVVVEDRRRSGPDGLDRAEQGGHAGVVGGQVRGVRPHEVGQPRPERHALPQAAGEALVEVRVGVDEARHAPRCPSSPPCARPTRPDSSAAVPTAEIRPPGHGHRAVVDDPAVVVERDDGAAGQQEIAVDHAADDDQNSTSVPLLYGVLPSRGRRCPGRSSAAGSRRRRAGSSSGSATSSTPCRPRRRRACRPRSSGRGRSRRSPRAGGCRLVLDPPGREDALGDDVGHVAGDVDAHHVVLAEPPLVGACVEGPQVARSSTPK